MISFMAMQTPFRSTWAVRRSGAKRARVAGLTRAAAWRECRRLARGIGAAAFLMGADGRVAVRLKADGVGT